MAVLGPVDEPRLVYCPECVIGLLRGASGEDEQDDEPRSGVNP